MTKLSPRLQAIADFVQPGTVVADIGTDHGYVPVYLIENNIVPKAIAADINEGPLDNATSYIEERHLTDKIDTRLGNGLKPLKAGEVDTIIIAGMGGILIKDILKASKTVTDKVEALILQPMVGSEILRAYLYEHGFVIVDERLVKEDDRIYEVIHVKHGEAPLEDTIYFDVGKRLFENKDPLLGAFIERKILKFKEIMVNLKESKNESAQEKYILLKNKCEKLERMLEAL